MDYQFITFRGRIHSPKGREELLASAISSNSEKAPGEIAGFALTLEFAENQESLIESVATEPADPIVKIKARLAVDLRCGKGCSRCGSYFIAATLAERTCPWCKRIEDGEVFRRELYANPEE